MGRNGVGKTSTLKSLMGLETRTRGTRHASKARRSPGMASHVRAGRGLGYVPEERAVFPQMTVEENIRIGALLHRGKDQRACWIGPTRCSRSCASAASRWPARSAAASRRCSRWRAGIALQPKLLMVDEPTEGLMPANVELIAQALLTGDQEGMAVLVVDSSFDLLRHAVQRHVRHGPRRADRHLSAGRLLQPGRARRHHARRGPSARWCANQILLQLLNGLVVGSSLALVAAGLALLFGVLHIINFAQGDFFMLGGYELWFVLALTHNYFLSVVIGAHGGRLRRTAADGDHLAAAAVAGPDPAVDARPEPDPGAARHRTSSAATPSWSSRRFASPSRSARSSTRPTTWSWSRSGMGMLVLGYFALQYTSYGIWLRAVAQNRPMAAALGVPVPRVYILALRRQLGLSALAGGLLLPLTSVYPTVGADVILNAFIVVVAGGLGNFRGAARSSRCWWAKSSRSGSLVLKPSSSRCCCSGWSSSC